MRWNAKITYTNGVVHEREFAEFGAKFVSDEAEGEDATSLDELVEAGPSYYYIASIAITPTWTSEHAAEMVDGSGEPVPEYVN